MVAQHVLVCFGHVNKSLVHHHIFNTARCCLETLEIYKTKILLDTLTFFWLSAFIPVAHGSSQRPASRGDRKHRCPQKTILAPEPRSRQNEFNTKRTNTMP